MVSTLVGQFKVCVGVEDGRLISYIDMTDDATANDGSVRCLVMLVNAFCPSQVATGALSDVELYGSNSFTVLSVPQDRSF